MLNEGFECAWEFDGKGGCRELTLEEALNWKSKEGFLWLHVKRDAGDLQRWMREQSGLEPLAVEALLAQDTRPRVTELDTGTLLFLRGVNLKPGAEPDDMISLRLFIEERRVISVRTRKLFSMEDLKNKLAAGAARSRNIGEFIMLLTRCLFNRLEPVLQDMEAQLDEAEDVLARKVTPEFRQNVTELRIQCSELRRHVASMRDVMGYLLTHEYKWIQKSVRPQLRENYELVTRILEGMDSARDRAMIMNDEIRNTLSERLSRNMYTISIFTAIFMPITFLTGLLGINVAGIPGAENPATFWIFLGLLTGIVLLEMLIFRRLKWL